MRIEFITECRTIISKTVGFPTQTEYLILERGQEMPYVFDRAVLLLNGEHSESPLGARIWLKRRSKEETR